MVASASAFPPAFLPDANRPRRSRPDPDSEPAIDHDGPVPYEVIARRLFELGLTPRLLDWRKVRRIEVRALRKLAIFAARQGLGK